MTDAEPDPHQDPLLGLAAIREFVKIHPGMTARAVGQAMTARLTKAQLRAFAADWVTDWVQAQQRAGARDVEESATRPRSEAEPSPHEDGCRCARCCRGIVDAGRRRDAETRFWGMLPRAHDLADPAWLGWDDLTVATFPYAGPWRLWRVPAPERSEHEQREIERRMHESVSKAMRDYADSIRLEVTAELLATPIALGDGTETTWGDATAEQHGQRREMLMRNAVGNAEAAGRHEAAIRMIRDAGAMCLREMAGG